MLKINTCIYVEMIMMFKEIMIYLILIKDWN